MTFIGDLVKLSKKSNSITIEATVDTGFECVAEEECRCKFGPEIPICSDRGRIYFNIDASEYPTVTTLRSVNNLKLVVDYLSHIDLISEEDSSEANIHNLNVVGELVGRISWNKHLDLWKDISRFKGNLYPSREDYLEAITFIKNKDISDREVISLDQQVLESHGDNEINDQLMIDNTGVLHYRVTCYRSGTHTFGSQDAARSFGGKLQDLFNWVVNLSKFNLEIILQLREKECIILITLTESSLHRRNIAHYGLTTLRSTVAFSILQLVKPHVGDIILDPMCGCGALPIEGAVGFEGTYHLCGDINELSVSLTRKNMTEYYNNFKKNLFVDPVRWDVGRLPLRNASIDIVASDMPFGKRVGSKLNNRTLYIAAFKELARVVKPASGRMALLTLDRTSYNKALRKMRKYWRQSRMMVVKMGGLKVCLYLLRRTDYFFR